MNSINPVDIKNKLVGTWRLLYTEIRYVNNQIGDSLFGTDATGYLLYNKDGYMSVAILFPNLPKSGLSAEHFRLTNFDKETSLFYCGRYTIYPDKLIHHIEISSHPHRPELSGNQERLFEFRENKLSLSVESELGGKQMIFRLIWELIQDYW